MPDISLLMEKTRLVYSSRCFGFFLDMMYFLSSSNSFASSEDLECFEDVGYGIIIIQLSSALNFYSPVLRDKYMYVR